MEATLKRITFAPPSWTIEKTANEFGVSKFMVNKARKLKKAKGILPDISPIKARKLSEESKTKVIDFYNDDEVSRMCPGKKDFVSVKNSEGKRVHVQKRLLLTNLRELHSHYKNKSSGGHVGFSKFCEGVVNSRHCGCFARFRRKLLICCSGRCSRLLLGQQSNYTASTSCLLSEKAYSGTLTRLNSP